MEKSEDRRGKVKKLKLQRILTRQLTCGRSDGEMAQQQQYQEEGEKRRKREWKV